MNKADRKELENALELIESAKEIINSIKDGEQEKFDNLTEGLQQTERGQRFEEIVDQLESCDSSLEEAIDYINEVM